MKNTVQWVIICLVLFCGCLLLPSEAWAGDNLVDCPMCRGNGKLPGAPPGSPDCSFCYGKGVTTRGRAEAAWNQLNATSDHQIELVQTFKVVGGVLAVIIFLVAVQNRGAEYLRLRHLRRR